MAIFSPFVTVLQFNSADVGTDAGDSAPCVSSAIAHRPRNVITHGNSAVKIPTRHVEPCAKLLHDDRRHHHAVILVHVQGRIKATRYHAPKVLIRRPDDLTFLRTGQIVEDGIQILRPESCTKKIESHQNNVFMRGFSPILTTDLVMSITCTMTQHIFKSTK